MKTSQRLSIVGQSRRIRHIFTSRWAYPASPAIHLSEDVLDEFGTELNLSTFFEIEDTYDPTKDLLVIVTGEALVQQ